MVENLGRVLDQVGRDKGIDRKILVETIESAMLAAAKKVYGAEREIEAHFNEDKGEVEVFEFKVVAETVEDPIKQISLTEARELDPEVETGDSLGIKLDATVLGRISAQSAKQVIIQKMRDAERDIIFEEFKKREGEVVSGTVRRYERGNVVVDLGKTEAILPPREQIPLETYRPGDRVRALVMEIDRSGRGPQIVLSRTSPKFLIKLFEMEVPEIYERVVEIRMVAREPGARAKVAVSSRDSDVDPVGACVGVKGSRVQNIVQELRGERVDIIPFTDNPAKLVVSALAPASISSVILDESSKAMEVIVPDDQLSLAIGKKGQNVRLAVQLTDWKIDIRSESEAAVVAKKAREELYRIPGISSTSVELLYEAGYRSPEEIVKDGAEHLKMIPGLDEENALRIFTQAGELMSGEKSESPVEPQVPAEAPEKSRDSVSSPGLEELKQIPGVGEKLAEVLLQSGFADLSSLAEAEVGKLAEVKGLGPKKAEKIIAEARIQVEQKKTGKEK
jgi:N utilization substance protein A